MYILIIVQLHTDYNVAILIIVYVDYSTGIPRILITAVQLHTDYSSGILINVGILIIVEVY